MARPPPATQDATLPPYFASVNPNVLLLTPALSTSETPTVRSKHAHQQLVTHPKSLLEQHPDIRTMADIIPYAKAHHPKAPAMGKRTLIKVHVESKKVSKVINGETVEVDKDWTYYEMGSYSWMSTEEVAIAVERVGAALIHLGVQQDDKVCIASSTCREWQMMAHGCFSQRICITTAYDTLGVAGLLHAVTEAQVKAIFTNADSVELVVTKIIPSAASLTIVIYDGDESIAAKYQTDAIKVLTFAQLEALGKDHPVDRKSPDPADLACIMYTSGSTGPPKGVEITHANMIASIAGVSIVADPVIKDTDVYLAYLPLAHILELMLESYGIFRGMQLGYGNPKTLTDASMRNCSGDIKTLKPTILTGVPSVWDAIKKGVEVKVKASPKVVQAVFNVALKMKQSELARNSKFSLVPDSIIFNKVRLETGGRLRYAISGGAPLSADTHAFVSAVICPLLQGFGATESCGLSMARTPEYGFATRNIGGPMPSVEVKLVNCAECGYMAANHQGEILLRGPPIMKGYYKRPDLTAEVLTEDGWYKTGDIGHLQPDGTLCIIDRAKNLIKLANGEYIAVERLESVYSACLYITRLCIHADSSKNSIIALGTVNWAVLLPAVKPLNVLTDTMSHEEICKHSEICSFILKDFAKIAKSNSLAPAELIKAVVLCDEDWTPQNEMLTAAMKLQRRSIVKHFADRIKAVYDGLA